MSEHSHTRFPAPLDWVEDAVAEAEPPETQWQRAVSELSGWASVRYVHPDDGWEPETICGRPGRRHHGYCRIDKRFHGASACAVRRLSGDNLAETLVAFAAAIAKNHEGGHVIDGRSLVNGIMFRFDTFGGHGESPSVCIHDAEVVVPHASHPPELVRFFADLWAARAMSAQTVSDMLNGISPAPAILAAPPAPWDAADPAPPPS